MKVLPITLHNFRHSRRLRGMHSHRVLGLACGLLLSGCRAPAAHTPTALRTPPVESIALTLAERPDATRALIRTVMASNGYQVDAESRPDGWLRTNLGGQWEDRALYRQWYLVVQYAGATSGGGAEIRLRAFEQATWFNVNTIRRNNTPELTDGFTRVVVVTDVTTGAGADAWRRLERLALRFTDRGAELLTELTIRRP
jgi:hypothetical protein